MKHYEFKIMLNAYGETAGEAWNNAVEEFSMNSGWFEEDDITYIEEVHEGTYDSFDPPRILKD